MVFPSTKAKYISVKLNDKYIENVHYCRYLDILIDDMLTWTPHIKKYFVFVHPHILYGVEVYANTGDVHLQKLITLNNKLLRILQSKSYNYPVKKSIKNTIRSLYQNCTFIN